MAPNHDGDTIESILGPMGSHWVQKLGQNRKKFPCPKIRIFDCPAVIGFSQKMEVAVMVPNHDGDTMESILGPMGSHWVKKNGSKQNKNTMPQNSNFRLPRGHRFFPKNGSHGYGAKSRWGPSRVRLGANGVPLGPKMGQNREKWPCPKIRIFVNPAVIDFSQKMEVTVMAPNHGGDTIESILGPMGSPWVQEMSHNHNKLPCLKIRIFDYPAVIDFSQKMEVTVMAPNHGGDTIESILGPMGSHWVQKMGQNHKKLPCPKFRIFDYPAVIDFSQKMEVTVMAPNHGGDPLGSILGPMGPHWVQKMGQNRRKLPCPKIRFFYYLAVIDFSPKMEVTVMAPNHDGDTIQSILGPMGSYWVKKMGQNRKKLPCPKVWIFDYPAVIDFSQKMEVTVIAPNHGWDTIELHLGAKRVPLG